MDDQDKVDDSWDFFDTQPTTPHSSHDIPVATKKPPTRPRSAKPERSPNQRDLTESGPSEEESELKRWENSHSPKRDTQSRSRSRSYSSCSDSESRDSRRYSNSKSGGRHSKRSASSVSDSSSRSRSRSPSTYSSDSETQSRTVSWEEDQPKADRSLPRRGRSRLGEDEYSSSAYSDGDDDDANTNNSRSTEDSRVKRGRKTTAWSEEASQDSIKVPSSNSRGRPKTAKGGKGAGARRGRSRSPSDDSEALSESDMTDVSPMDSPRPNKTKGKKGGGPEPGSAKYRAMPLTDDDVEESHYGEEPANGLDLEILMKAVGELEKQKRLQENSRRVMFAPMTLKRSEKNNYTFDKAKSKDIDRENQRLLKEIVRRVNKTGDKRRPAPPPTHRLTASAINRERDMKRIETENLAFLKRLQKVKPTKSMSRDSQLATYNSTTLHGVPMAALHPMPGRRRPKSAYSDADSIGSRTRSVSSINSLSVVSTVRSATSSQAGSRPSSATKRVDTRPAWNDRW